MSADNWTVCPRCKARHELKAQKLRAAADHAYGTATIEQWKVLDADAHKAAEPFVEQTFREDYEISGAEDGAVGIDYRGGCGICGLSCSFKHSIPIEGITS